MFNGKSKIDQHKIVYKALGEKMGNELHALQLTTEGTIKMSIKDKIKEITENK